MVTLPTNTTWSKPAGFAFGGTNIVFRSDLDRPERAYPIEFVAVDLGTGGTDSTGADEGFKSTGRVRFFDRRYRGLRRLTGDKTTTTNRGASYVALQVRQNSSGVGVGYCWHEDGARGWWNDIHSGK